MLGRQADELEQRIDTTKQRASIIRPIAFSVVRTVEQGIQQMFQILLIIAALSGLEGPASAQSSMTAGTSGPLSGGTSSARPAGQMPLIESQNANIMRHRDFSGKPCLTAFGYARPDTLDPHLFYHEISVANGCDLLIKTQFCYYRSQHCISLDIPGRSRKQATLGIFPALKDFQFEFTERF